MKFGYTIVYVFAVSLHWLPAIGQLDPRLGVPPVTHFSVIDAILTGRIPAIADAFAHLILPSIALGSIPLAIVTRITRASVIDVSNEDYVRTARAKGLAERGVVRRHAFPNALVPILTLAGLAYAELLAGTVLTETIFSWPGLGRYTYQSALAIDFPAIMGVTFLVALMYLAINLLVDIAYGLIDPRIRTE